MIAPRRFWEVSRLPGLAPCVCSETQRCRCGSAFGRELPCFHFATLPTSLTELFEDQRFCGTVCARAFILEALEFIESAPASSPLSELDQVRVSLRFLLTLLSMHGGPVAAPSPWGASDSRAGFS